MKTPVSFLKTLTLAWLAASVQAAEIHDAAEADDVARINTLLATNATLLNLPGKDELTPLHAAARQGKIKALSALLERGAEVNAKDVHGCTPLHSAAYGGHTRAAEYLLGHGAEVDITRADGTTPLYYAAKDGRTNLVDLLLKRGAKPDASSETGLTPLHAAAQAGQLPAAELLVAAGANIAIEDKEGHTALHLAAKAGERAMAEWLLNHGADPDAKDHLRMKPLDYVVGVTNAPLAALLEQHMKPRLEQALPVKVGEAGDPDRILFEGLRTFTADQVRHALATKPSYLLAAHPQADMHAFLDELKAMVESGCQAGGFPDAKAEIIYDEQAFRVRVKVTEGPRFLARKVQVAGSKLVIGDELVRWFTTTAGTSKTVETLKSSLASAPAKDADSGITWNAQASVNLNNRPGGLNTPGKAERPDEPMWVSGDPANFSAAWATQAVAQVEACLAEQGFFFPKARVELQRDVPTASADLLITILEEGPPGVIGEVTVAGMKRHKPGDILRFLELREGMKITAERLAMARQKLRDCGRFWDFEITPEYVGLDTVSSRHVYLHIEVKEQDGVPRLDEPLSPVQQALLRVCDWVERFPTRDEDVQVTITNRDSFPFALQFVLSPLRGLLLTSTDLPGGSPISAGFCLSQESVQLCAWASSNKLSALREGGGSFFLHLLPDKSGGSNHFNMQVGAGYQGHGNRGKPDVKPALTLDVQLTRAAFLDLATRAGSRCTLEGGTLVVTNEGFTFRADATTGRLVELVRLNEQPTFEFRFGLHVWDQVKRDFARRSEPLTNGYAPGRGLSSLAALAGAEVARFYLAEDASATNATQHYRALMAMRKLLNPELLLPVDRLLGGSETNAFNIPMDEVDKALAMNSLAAFFSGFAFDWSNKLFPKYSWPWTAAREAAFVMISQGRYTDAELDRLYNSEDTGPIGCLALAHLLSAAGSPAAKTFALQGVMRLGTADFLRDCNLFLRGESGLARGFAKTTDALRGLSEDEVAGLTAALPEAEATLLRECAAALRAKPESPADSVLAPALGKYWEESLRAKVRAALYRLTTPTKASDRSAAATPEENQDRGTQI